MSFINYHPNSLIYINNRHTRFEQYKADPACLGFLPSGHERGRDAASLFEDCLRRYMIRHCGWSDFSIEALRNDSDKAHRKHVATTFEQLDQYSLRQFLREIARVGNPKDSAKQIKSGEGVSLSRDAIDLICAVLAFEMSLSSSMADAVRMYSNIFRQNEFDQIENGIDLLPRSFIGLPNHTASTSTSQFASDNERLNLSQNIVYNARAVEIERMPPKSESDPVEDPIERTDHLVITYENVITRKMNQSRADLVILALPFSALRHIRMFKLASVAKRRALRQLHYDNACKILLEFSKPFWDGCEHPIKGGRSITDLPIRQTFYPNPKQNRNAVLLASYTWGDDDSLRWISLKADDRIRFALRDLGRVHAQDLSGLFVGGMSHSWAEHEYTSGAFSVFEPYQCVEMFEDIWIPEGRLHYTGEHTSTKHAWIEGAEVGAQLNILDEAVPTALLHAYALELRTPVSIPEQRDVSAKLSGLLQSYANGLGSSLRGFEPGATLRPVFPARTGVIDTFFHVGHFIPIAAVVAVVELIFPITLWLYTLFALKAGMARPEDWMDGLEPGSLSGLASIKAVDETPLPRRSRPVRSE